MARQILLGLMMIFSGIAILNATLGTRPAVPATLHVAAPAATNPNTDPVVPPQMHDVYRCAADDKACIQAWFTEYKTAIVEELHGWQDRVIPAVRRKDAASAAFAIRWSSRNEWANHDRWSFATPEQISNAGLDGEAEALWECRQAVVEALFAAMDVNDADAYRDYVAKSGVCFKHFEAHKKVKAKA